MPRYSTLRLWPGIDTGLLDPEHRPYHWVIVSASDRKKVSKKINKNVISDMLPRDEGRQGQCLGPGEQTSACDTEKERK